MWVEVITNTERKEELIQAYHSGIVRVNSLTAINMGGHVGKNKTSSKNGLCILLAQIQEDIAQYISTCERCQWVNTTKLQKS